MAKLDDAINRIKILECPTGKMEERITGILEDYGVAGNDGVAINRDRRYDENGAVAYRADIPGNEGQSIVVLAKAGMDDYVAKVVDAYKTR